MNEDFIVSRIKRDHIAKLIGGGRREDGRRLDEFRKLRVETGLIESADGSARVDLGDTTVIAGVKIVPGTPYADAPADGTITTGAEFTAMAHPTFEPGPPGEDAIELARVVDRGIRESGMVEVGKLCIKEGEQIWMVYIDIYIINHDGNLFDASNIASVCALKTAVIPNGQYGIKDGAGNAVPDAPLPTVCLPVSVTHWKIGNDLIVDPNFDEEAIASARLTVCTDDAGNYRAMQKGGKGSITRADLEHCLDAAVELGRRIREQIKG